MNKKFKNIVYATLISLTMCLQAGCSDMLDQAPQGGLTEDDLTGGTFESEVFNMYALLRGYHLTTGNTAMAIHFFRSEDAEK